MRVIYISTSRWKLWGQHRRALGPNNASLNSPASSQSARRGILRSCRNHNSSSQAVWTDIHASFGDCIQVHLIYDLCTVCTVSLSYPISIINQFRYSFHNIICSRRWNILNKDTWVGLRLKVLYPMDNVGLQFESFCNLYGRLLVPFSILCQSGTTGSR